MGAGLDKMGMLCVVYWKGPVFLVPVYDLNWSPMNSEDLSLSYFLCFSTFQVFFFASIFTISTSLYCSWTNKFCGGYWEELIFKMPVATSSSDSGKCLGFTTMRASAHVCMWVSEEEREVSRGREKWEEKLKGFVVALCTQDVHCISSLNF